MEFPDYVPAIVRRQAISYLSGDGKYNKGWISSLADYEAEIKKAKKLMLEYTKTFKEYGGEHIPHKLTNLKVEQADVEENYQSMKRDAQCINRLIHDVRMASVYESLVSLFPQALNKIDLFIQIAWSTAMPVTSSESMDAKILSKALVKDIAETTDVLIHLLERLVETDVILPPEFFDIAILLERTSNPEQRLWNDVSPTLLGNQSAMDEEQGDHNKVRRNAIKTAWKSAPNLENILKTLSSAAESFHPVFEEQLDNIASVRHINIKQVYLKAFVENLEEANIYIPENAYDAIAVTAAVIINKPDIEVSRYDVNYAFAHLNA